MVADACPAGKGWRRCDCALCNFAATTIFVLASYWEQAERVMFCRALLLALALLLIGCEKPEEDNAPAPPTTPTPTPTAIATPIHQA